MTNLPFSMTLREISNKSEWEAFLLSAHQKTFLQSWNWGDFNVAMGNSIWRFGIFESEH